MAVAIEHWRFSVDDYYRMAEAGILTEEDRVELIEGEIYKMSPMGSRHAGTVNRTSSHLRRQVGDDAIISVQNPIRIDHYSEPEPDIMLLSPRVDYYSNSHPTPSDVFFIIEVSDTSYRYDRDTKVPLYARAGIPVVWLVHLETETVEIFSHPVNGTYQVQQTAIRGERLTLDSLPGLSLSVDDLLG